MFYLWLFANVFNPGAWLWGLLVSTLTALDWIEFRLADPAEHPYPCLVYVVVWVPGATGLRGWWQSRWQPGIGEPGTRGLSGPGSIILRWDPRPGDQLIYERTEVEHTLKHELRHQVQYVLGLLQHILYALDYMRLFLLTPGPIGVRRLVAYRGNWFEREARAHDGRAR